MSVNQWEPYNWKPDYEKAFAAKEAMADFIQWLFETELDYLDYQETWDKYQKHLNIKN